MLSDYFPFFPVIPSSLSAFRAWAFCSGSGGLYCMHVHGIHMFARRRQSFRWRIFPPKLDGVLAERRNFWQLNAKPGSFQWCDERCSAMKPFPVPCRWYCAPPSLASGGVEAARSLWQAFRMWGYVLSIFHFAELKDPPVTAVSSSPCPYNLFSIESC